jgi:hypothetical protein
MCRGQQVRLQRVTPKTANRVFRYGTKLDQLPLDGDLLKEYVEAMRGLRLMGPWGSLYHVPPEVTELTIGEPVGTPVCP